MPQVRSVVAACKENHDGFVHERSFRGRVRICAIASVPSSSASGSARTSSFARFGLRFRCVFALHPRRERELEKTTVLASFDDVREDRWGPVGACPLVFFVVGLRDAHRFQRLVAWVFGPRFSVPGGWRLQLQRRRFLRASWVLQLPRLILCFRPPVQSSFWLWASGSVRRTIGWVVDEHHDWVGLWGGPGFVSNVEPHVGGRFGWHRFGLERGPGFLQWRGRRRSTNLRLLRE